MGCHKPAATNIFAHLTMKQKLPPFWALLGLRT